MRVFHRPHRCIELDMTALAHVSCTLRNYFQVDLLMFFSLSFAEA